MSTRVRSNKQFQDDGLRKKIQYQILLSNSRNPDFVVRHPNELKSKNQDWKKEITNRVTQEHNVMLKLHKVRLIKKTSHRRLNNLD